jgi:hypothetical protein
MWPGSIHHGPNKSTNMTWFLIVSGRASSRA